MAPNGKCVFNLKWLEKDVYKDWLLADGKDKHRAICRACNKSFSIGSMGESALTSHTKYNKHIDFLKAMVSTEQLFLSLESPNAKGNEDSSRKEEKQLQNYLQSSESLDAEILWVLRTVKCHHSYRSNTDVDKVFKRMFPDSSIAANFSCSERKSSYVAVFGLAPYFKNILLKDLEAKSFVLLFDETFNKKNLSKQMDIYARYWLNDCVKTSFITAVFLGHATAEDLFENILSSILPLSLINILQLSMDGPNVNLKLHRMIDEHIFNDYGNHLINIGTCSLHVIHNAFKQGFEMVDWDIETFLSSIYQLFRHSPARREDFSSISEAHFPLKFVSHRWVENVPVCERALEIFPLLQTYIMKIEKKEFDEPTAKSFSIIRSNVKSHLFPVKLNIFLSVANIVKPFLTKFQTDKPMLPYMSADIKKMILALMQKFLKPNLLKKDDVPITLVNLMKIDFQDPKNHLSTEKIDLGFVAEKQVKKLHSSKKVSDGEILNLRRDLKCILMKMLSVIISKSPAKFSIVRNLVCLIPRNLVEDKQGCLRKMKHLLTSLSDLNVVKISDCDEIQADFINFVNVTVCENTEDFLKYDNSKMRLDNFLSLHLRTKHVKAWSCIQKLLLLSHGQATVERGFSINRKIEVENLKENSYVALRIICDHINNLDGDVTKVVINKELRKSVMMARHRYSEYLEEEKNVIKAQKRKKDEDENEFLKKRKYLERCIEELSKSADDFADQAEKQNDMTLLAKSNSLRKSAKEKKNELLKLVEKNKN